jgi:MFS transporter, Spinster family, sphingosine-1-phosphate transporter
MTNKEPGRFGQTAHAKLADFTSDQKRVLLVLTLINFVNWIDRQIVYPLFPLIKDNFHVSYAQLGWLVATFSVVHALGSLGLGRLADLTSRKKVISYGIAFWSAATFMSGVAPSFRSLLVCRASVGVGEAAYAPAGNAMISATFPKGVRARVQGFFDLGMFTGGALGLALGAILAQSVGWRPAFFIVGVPGVLLALSVRGLPEQSRKSKTEKIPLRELARVPAYLFVLVSGWFSAFAGYTYVIWGAEFVYRYKAFSLRQAGILLGSVMLLAGILGVMTGACVADRLAKVFVWGRALTPAIGFLVSAPFILAALHAGSKFAVLCLLFSGTFFMTWYHGPVTAVIHDLTPPRNHASAIGLYYFFVNFFATTTASALVGKLADRYGLLAGMHCAVIAQVVGGMGFFAVIHSIRRQCAASRRASHGPEDHGSPEPQVWRPAPAEASE